MMLEQILWDIIIHALTVFLNYNLFFDILSCYVNNELSINYLDETLLCKNIRNECKIEIWRYNALI